MAKTNGRRAQPKTVPMAIGGTIRLALTEATFAELCQGKEIQTDQEAGPEFYLKIERKALKDAVLHFSPWFWSHESRLKISNSATTDGSLDEAIEFSVYDSEDRRFAFVLNAEQAEALAGVLQHFAQAWKSIDALRADQPTA